MKQITVLALVCSACAFVAEGTGESGSSDSSSGDAETIGDQSATTTATTTTGTSASTSSGTDVTTGDTDATSEGTDDGTESESEGSTGDPIADYALSFDGSSHARKIDNSGVYDWSVDDYTVEAWIRIDDTSATGVIFDGTNASFTSGWVLYLHNDWHALVFSFFDQAHLNNVVMGPSVEEIGTGWHHIAATKNGTSVLIHVDGVTKVVEEVPAIVGDDATIWTLGTGTSLDPSFSLRDVAIDDLRVTAYARYADNFLPPIEYDDSLDSVLLLLRIDEGEGVLLGDDAAQLDFTIDDPVWVPGNNR